VIETPSTFLAPCRGAIKIVFIAPLQGAEKRRKGAYTPSCGGYAALAWGYGY
jgi:hypothetical protein